MEFLRVYARFWISVLCGLVVALQGPELRAESHRRMDRG